MIQIVYKNGKPIVYQVASNNTPAPPVNISAPFLEGTGEIGTNVICRKGVWSGFPAISYTYDFKVGGLSVQNSSSNLYIPQPIDNGKVITCEVTATNSEGSASATTSNSITVGTAPVNTVAPTVSPSGTQITGTVITASVGTWTGTPTITYEYRWTRNGSPISGAVNSTYTIQAADDGTTIRCEVRGTNAYATSSFVPSSNSVSAVNAIAPVNTVAPVISGSTTLGSTLTSTTGTWTGIPTPTYSYQWKRNGSNIGGATASTYVTTLADSSANITCDVTATNTGGSVTAGSNTITLPSYAPVNTVLPVVSGTAVVGQTLSTTNGTWTNSPSTFAYQWFRGATPIGTNSANYTLVQADAGNTSNITCRVTATNSAGSTNATSNTIAQIIDSNANTYIVNSGNTSFTSAINQFVLDLKSNNLWSKMNRVYPFLGGTASSCAVDLVTGTSGTFSGTFTYSANGPLPNGTNAFFNTGLNATTLTANNNHFSFDSFTNNNLTTSDFDMGVSTNAQFGSDLFSIILRRSSDLCAFDSGTFSGGRVSSTTTNSNAYFVGSIVSTADRRLFRNGTQLNINTAATSQVLPNGNIFIFAINSLALPGAQFFGSKGSRLVTIGSGLSASEVTTLQTIRTTFQNAVGR